MKNQSRIMFLVCICIAGILLSSCSVSKSIKDLPYFKDFKDTMSYARVKLPEYQSLVIQPQDMLNILVDNKGTLSSGPTSAIISGEGSSGYLVSEEGIVTLPIFGNVKLAGMTTKEAQQFLQKKMDFLYNSDTTYKNAVVRVNFAGVKINILGEVGKPGPILLPLEKSSILDAIAQAGDLTEYGKRNITLMRDSSGYRTMRRLSLNSTNIMSSPYFYLKQNDMIIVPAYPAKGQQALLGPTFRNISFVISIVTFITVMILRFK